MVHVAVLRNQFFLKRLSKLRSSVANRGKLSIFYVFVDSHSEDFELVEVPTDEPMVQAPPTQPLAEGDTNEQVEELELPPGWEERRVRCRV